MDSLRIPLPNQSFNLQAWSHALRHYFDGPELVKNFTFGWDISFLSPPDPRHAPANLPSASLAANDVDSYISQELQYGALLGPFLEQDLPFRVFCSPIGTVKKANSSTRRTIIDCSQRSAGINSWISAHWHRGVLWNLSLPTSDDIVDMVQRNRASFPGTNLKMFKIDFSRWYRFLLLDPGVAPFFALRWNGKIFLDLAYSFGNRGAALSAQRVLWSICWLFRCHVSPAPGVLNSGSSCRCSSHCKCGSNTSVAYIDDSVAIAPSHLADYQFSQFVSLCKKLGITLSETPGHLVPPSSRCTALGLEYDLDLNTISLPADKVSSLLEMLHAWLSKESASEKELASFAGRLIYAAGVISSGRLFLNRVLATKRRATSSGLNIILDEAFFDDVRWWISAINLRNGVTFLEFAATTHIAMDASSDGWTDGLPGIGIFNFTAKEFVTCPPPPHLQHLHIADLELLAHVLAGNLWGPSWSTHKITGETDSSACFYLLQNGRTRHQVRLEMSRHFSTTQVRHNFKWKTQWISTHLNVLPDALSRWGDPKYRKIFQEHCKKLGIHQPVQRHVTPEMFTF